MKNKYILSFFILIIILFFSSFVSAAITKQELPSVLSKEEFENGAQIQKHHLFILTKKGIKKEMVNGQDFMILLQLIV